MGNFRNIIQSIIFLIPDTLTALEVYKLLVTQGDCILYNHLVLVTQGDCRTIRLCLIASP